MDISAARPLVRTGPPVRPGELAPWTGVADARNRPDARPAAGRVVEGELLGRRSTDGPGFADISNTEIFNRRLQLEHASRRGASSQSANDVRGRQALAAYLSHIESPSSRSPRSSVDFYV